MEDQPRNEFTHSSILASQSILDQNPREDELKVNGWDPVEIRNQIDFLFSQEEIFKQKGLTVADLADLIKVSPKELPSVFKHLFNSDFKTYVNEYRVNFAKKLIDEGYLGNFTLEALGEYSGFNSRITFFNSFKKHIGVSPSEYRKNSKAKIK